MVSRRRAEPSGTLGYRIGDTKNPSSRIIFAMEIARALSPTMIGTMADSVRAEKPRLSSSRMKKATFLWNRSTRSGSSFQDSQRSKGGCD